MKISLGKFLVTFNDDGDARWRALRIEVVHEDATKSDGEDERDMPAHKELFNIRPIFKAKDVDTKRNEQAAEKPQHAAVKRNKKYPDHVIHEGDDTEQDGDLQHGSLSAKKG